MRRLHPSSAQNELLEARVNVAGILAFTDWASSAARRTHTDDHFARWLATSGAVGHGVVAAPFHSAARRFVRRVRHREMEAFPAGPDASIFQPTRRRWRQPPDAREARTVAGVYSERLRRHCRGLGLESVHVISFNPVLAGFGPFEWASSVTYYAVDDFAVGGDDPRAPWRTVVGEAYREMASTARPVVAVSPAILRRIAPTGRSLLLPNGIDVGRWARPEPPPGWLSALPRPIVVYAGMIDERLDTAALQRTAAAIPDGTVLLVGPLRPTADRVALDRLHNAHFAGALAPESMPSVIAACDLAVVPHRVTEVTRAMSPLKIYEALGAGLPVVASDLEPIRSIDGDVRLVTDGDWATAVAETLAGPRRSAAETAAFLTANSWDGRFRQLVDFASG